MAKQASELLDFVQSLRFVFTANITGIIRIMAKGQVKMFKAALTAKAKYNLDDLFVYDVCLNVYAENWKRNNPKRSE